MRSENIHLAERVTRLLDPRERTDVFHRTEAEKKPYSPGSDEHKDIHPDYSVEIFPLGKAGKTAGII